MLHSIYTCVGVYVYGDRTCYFEATLLATAPLSCNCCKLVQEEITQPEEELGKQ